MDLRKVAETDLDELVKDRKKLEGYGMPPSIIDICIDPQGNIILSTSHFPEIIYKFDGGLGIMSRGLGKMVYGYLASTAEPFSIAVSQDNIFSTDFGKISKFDLEGRIIKSDFIRSEPKAIEVVDDSIYAIHNKSVERFNLQSGKLIEESSEKDFIGDVTSCSGNLYLLKLLGEGIVIYEGNKREEITTEMPFAGKIAVDPDQNIWLDNIRDKRLGVYSIKRKSLERIDTIDFELDIQRMRFDDLGNLYVAGRYRDYNSYVPGEGYKTDIFTLRKYEII